MTQRFFRGEITSDQAIAELLGGVRSRLVPDVLQYVQSFN
jgi:hypothetical protein